MSKTKKKMVVSQRAKAEARRRQAAAERIGPQPPKLPKRPCLRDLNPPGSWYKSDNWHRPGPMVKRLGASGARQFARQANADMEPGEAEINEHMLEVLIRYADTYGRSGVPGAAFTLDKVVRTSSFLAEVMEAQQLDEEEALAAVHDLHALGLLWVDDDGAVWRSIPPGIPDPENAEWRMCDRVLVPQRKI
ncbi:hypothetical protein [Streptomyces sp. NPDC003006]